MIIFPPSIVNDDINRPVIIFRNRVKTDQPDKHIVFPIPQSIQFSDSATYNNNAEIGFKGGLILAAGRSQSVKDAFSNVASGAISAIPSSIKDLTQMLSAHSSRLDNGVKSAIGIATGKATNMNIVTEFSGIQTRAFSFQFKLVMTSKKESDIVKNICDTFRVGLYPEGTSAQLTYPATWYINFTKGGKEIDYIPKIFETYLTGMTATYNPSSNLHHVDGSPVEMDLQLSFVESRALTKADVVSLVKSPFSDGDFTRAYTLSKKLPTSVDNSSTAHRLTSVNHESSWLPF
jgi:hypothetical protein